MFSQKLKEIMELRNISAAEIAKASGLTEATISILLNKKGKGDPRISTVEKLAKALRISPAYFFEANTLGPSELLSHMTPEERAIVLSEDFLPWVQLTRKAIDEGVPLEAIRQIIDIVISNKGI